MSERLKIPEQRQYLCPDCKHPFQWSIPVTVGPMRSDPPPCRECGYQINGVEVAEDGSVSYESGLFPESAKRAWHLLRLVKTDEPIYFVMKGTDYHDRDGNAFFYEEHSCPTNWIRHTEEIWVGSDNDPHGFLEYVDSVKDEDVKTGGINDDLQFVDAFPQLKELVRNRADEEVS